jgi:ATP synthase subunit G
MIVYQYTNPDQYCCISFVPEFLLIVILCLVQMTNPNRYLSFWLGRGDRMKQAKVEAQALIQVYRNEKQEEFNNMVLSKGGSEGNASAKLQADTNKEVQEMQALFQKNAQKAVDILLSKCCEVSLEVPTARVRATQKLAGVVA